MRMSQLRTHNSQCFSMSYLCVEISGVDAVMHSGSDVVKKGRRTLHASTRACLKSFSLGFRMNNCSTQVSYYDSDTFLFEIE